MDSSASLQPAALRRGLGRFATGVTIVTCRDDQGAPVGLTANSFSSLSLDPPLILWSLRAASPSVKAFCAADAFAINVLGESQVDLSRRFASAQPNKFDEGQWSAGWRDVPVLGGCAAVIECEPFDARQTGDHWLFIGRVQRISDSAIAPLVFQGGHYHLLGEIL
jgi:flavin reductase (DIM6/NTAB) family NADH-FMN oxidoreductase RutF